MVFLEGLSQHNQPLQTSYIPKKYPASYSNILFSIITIQDFSHLTVTNEEHTEERYKIDPIHTPGYDDNFATRNQTHI